MNTPSLKLRSLVQNLCSVTILLTCSVTHAGAEKLGLQQYLEQVGASHEGLKASELRAAGFKNQASEKGMLYSPYLIGQAQFLSDSKETTSPSAQGTKTTASLYSIGISQLTPFGLKGQLSYQLSKTDIEGAQASLLPTPKFWDGRPYLQVSQSLWRNFFGSETRAQLNAIESRSLGSHFVESFKSKQLRASAEAIYWKARLSKKSIELRKETKDRAQQLKDWTQRRVSLQLADKSDLLQADSALKLRSLELELAEDDAKEAARAFNSYRNLDSDEVSEEFDEPNATDLASLQAPEKSAPRDDTKAAEQMSVVNRSNAQMNLERGRPTLEVSGSFAFNGRDVEMDQSISNSLKNDHNTYTVGIMLNAPLGFPFASRLKEGALQERDAAELEYKRKLFEEQEDWKNLTRKFQAAKDRLKLVRLLEDSQKEKVLHERGRLRKGRTTTFQVLLFEEDYATSKLNRLRSEVEVLSLHAQLRTFL